MIDRYLLRYFLAVVDRGSFSKAAQQVNVAQPTLSVGIAKLERLLGAPLFQRSSQRVHLTEAGARLLSHARRIESEFNLAERITSGRAPERTVRLGVLRTIPTALLEAAVASVAGAEGSFELVEGSERDLLQRLNRGRIDVALTILREGADRFLRELLFEEGYRLVLPAGHPLGGEEVVTAEALAGERMIVRRNCEALPETSRHFVERGVRPFFAFRTTDDDRAMAMVRAGLAITVAPACYASERTAHPRLAGFDISREIGLLYAGHADELRHASIPILTALREEFRPLSTVAPSKTRGNDGEKV
jgi:DNA-binding transcriptional LysR family regulator